MNETIKDKQNEGIILKGDKKPEIFIIGQLDYGKNFKTQEGLSIEFILEHDEEWEFLSYNKRFQTHTAYENNTGTFNWAHSFELYLSPNKIINWPKIFLRVYRLDHSNKIDLFSIGEIVIPSKSGYHKLVCSTWRPYMGFRSNNIEALMNDSPKLNFEEEIRDNRNEKLIGNVSGEVYINLEIAFRNISFN